MAFKIQDTIEIEQANKIFTDREEPRKAFWDKYKQYKDNMNNGRENPITILTYYGIGGIGKSTLLYKLQNEIDEYIARNNKKDVIPYAYYDMKTDTSKRAFLEGLRQILNKKYGFEFPLFELAIHIYLIKIGKSAMLKEHKGVINNNEYVGVATDIASAGVDLLNAVPLAGPLAAGTLKIIDKLIENQRNKNANRRIELSKLQNDSPEDILRNLQRYFAKDLSENLKDAKYPLVVFIDTYEMLVNELASVGEPLMNDVWLRDIHNGLVMHTPNVIWVIAGREIIKWDQINPGWKENFEQHLVGNLSQTDTKKFLNESNINDIQIQEQIYDITKGIPVYLDLCVQNYFFLVNNNTNITRELLGDDQRELVNRFMIYTDGNQKDILYIISCLDVWTEEYLIEIASKNFCSISQNMLKTIEGLSFIETIDGINFSMNQLIKEILYAQCNTDLKRKILSFDKNHNKEGLSKINPTSDEYINILKRYINTSMEQMLPEESCDELYIEVKENHINKLTDTFQYDDACLIYELLLQQKALSKYSRLTLAEIYLYYSHCLMKTGNYSKMDGYAEKSLKLYEENSDIYFVGRVDALENLGIIYCELGRTKEALEISEEVLELRKRILGDEHPDTIDAMANLSISYSKIGRTKEALEISEKVLELRKRILGDEHPNTILAMNNLSNRYSEVGRTKEALAISEKVLELYKRILGDEHPGTIMAMNNLSVDYSKAGRTKEALEISEKVLELRKRTLGDEHPDTLISMYNLSVYYSKAGRAKEALAISDKVLKLYRKVLGDEHPDTIRTIQANKYLRSKIVEGSN